MAGTPQVRASAWVVAAALAGTVAVLAAGTPPAAGATPSAAGACAVEAQAGAAEAALAARLLELVNGHRRSLGLRRVATGPALTRSAAWKAAHMARHGYLAHADLGRRTLAQRLRSCGYAGSGWGEVLAAGQRWPSAVMRGWLRSPSHRTVIEAPWWRYAGAGVSRSRAGDLYWALDFGA